MKKITEQSETRHTVLRETGHAKAEALLRVYRIKVIVLIEACIIRQKLCHLSSETGDDDRSFVEKTFFLLGNWT